MTATAKVFTAGHSQAVRLPKAFRVNVSEMWISKNEVTGEITLRPKEDNRLQTLEKLFRMIEENPLPDDFLSESDRQNETPRNPFAFWTNSEPGKESQ
ncbi:MAG: hypothetical protein KGZ83_15095 [Sulfuricella sp.]|nr:hypothetical protein [Sulfuricella sp.]